MKKLICIAFIFMLLPFSVGFQKLDNDGESAEVLTMMYHHITNNPKLVNTYTIMANSFEDDIRYLCENGYHFVTIKDLIAYAHFGKDLPSKAVMITFDDGYLSFYRYVYPVLKQYDAKAVLSVIGYWTEEYSNSGYENIVFSHVTWTQLREMSESGFVEIQNHTYNMHRPSPRKGTLKKQGESESEYKQNFCGDIMHAQNLFVKNSGIRPTAFTYPFGYIQDNTRAYLKEMGFAASLSCTSGVNHLKKFDKNSLFELKRYNRTDKKTIKYFAK